MVESPGVSMTYGVPEAGPFFSTAQAEDSDEWEIREGSDDDLSQSCEACTDADDGEQVPDIKRRKCFPVS